MTSLVPRDVESLIESLDANRDYGEDVSVEDVKARIRDGALLIHPAPEGTTQPLLADALTGKRVKGSGAPMGGQGPHQYVVSRMRERFAEDADAWYDALYKAGVVKGDVKAMDVAFKYAIPVPRGQMGEAFGAALQVLMEQMQKPQERYIEVKPQ